MFDIEPCVFNGRMYATYKPLGCKGFSIALSQEVWDKADNQIIAKVFKLVEHLRNQYEMHPNSILWDKQINMGDI